MVYIKENHLHYITEFKYSTTGYSKLEKLVDAIWWQRAILFCPKWLAPNSITVIGLLFSLFSYLIMIPFDTTCSLPIPSYILFISTLFQFVYQTFDALDGKQARIINQCSPLGMLLDHGCDSLSVLFFIYDAIQGLSLGITTSTVLLIIGIQTSFFLATLEEYHTHLCRTHVCDFGVGEGQFIVMIALVLTGINGSTMWKTDIIYGHTLGDMIVYANFLTGLMIGVIMISSTLIPAKNKLKPIIKLFPIICMGFSMYFWAKSPMMPSYAALILITHALIFSALCSKLIICSVSKMEFHWFDFNVILELCIVLEFYFIQVLPPQPTLIIFSIFIIFNYFSFITGVITQISSHLKIPVFSVKPPKIN